MCWAMCAATPETRRQTPTCLSRVVRGNRLRIILARRPLMQPPLVLYQPAAQQPTPREPERRRGKHRRLRFRHRWTSENDVEGSLWPLARQREYVALSESEAVPLKTSLTVKPGRCPILTIRASLSRRNRDEEENDDGEWRHRHHIPMLIQLLYLTRL